ncbi:hypothetical protein [Parafilimonas sp.]|uniref:hypothetical protein n=1 Tax=Parafilimonas sp. TaxID=1969739 RepID=UPI0039E39F25
MKYFTHPEGIFEIKIPLDWHYKNEVAGYENKSPFSFEVFEDVKGCFQISCYHKNEKPLNSELPKHDYNITNLNFIPTELPDTEFKILLWATTAGDYFFMAKYIYLATEVDAKVIEEQLTKVENCLSTLMCLSPDRREFAISFDRFEKFNVSLAASFDLKNRAMKSLSLVELIVLSANQIDAYLRLCIVFKFQIVENSLLFKLEYLFQREKDKPLMEKRIYDKAKDMAIISEVQHKKLYLLYDCRNKVVHRYIITDIKTKELLEISYEYELLCEEVRVILESIEAEQFDKKIGYHGTKDPLRKRDKNYVDELFSMVNDKHFYKEFYRNI